MECWITPKYVCLRLFFFLFWTCMSVYFKVLLKILSAKLLSDRFAGYLSLLCMWSNRKRKNTEREWSLITMVAILTHLWTYDHVSLHFFLTLAQSLIIMKCKFHWWEGLCFRLGEITAQACMLKKYFNQYINNGILTYLSKQISFHVNSLFCCFHFKSSEDLFPFLRCVF